MRHQPLFYPLLGGFQDLGFMRLSGVGLGNSFYCYFHTYLLNKKSGGRMIFPAWPSFKTGPLRRGDATKRFYLGLFAPAKDEICGPKKYLLLSKALNHSNRIVVGQRHIGIDASRLNVVSCTNFTFEGLHESRSDIRDRILEITRRSDSGAVPWGSEPYAAVHVRLGDFESAADVSAVNAGKVNTRVPISWYVNIIERIQKQNPGKPIVIVSDGKEEDLEDLLNTGARLIRAGSDVGDLLALASASLLVGSNSTFSRWAAFLGNMPSIWTSLPPSNETPSQDPSKLIQIPYGAEHSYPDSVFRWADI